MLAATGKLYSCMQCRQNGLDKHRFCNEDAPHPIYELDGEPIYRCPVSMLEPESLTALEAYAFYKAGHLPCSGGWQEQPNRIMEQMLIIEAAVNEEQQRCLGKTRSKS